MIAERTGDPIQFAENTIKGGRASAGSIHPLVDRVPATPLFQTQAG
jgi:hypothetical protein